MRPMCYAVFKEPRMSLLILQRLQQSDILKKEKGRRRAV